MTERSNEKALAILGQQYNGLITQTESWDFFRGLADYTKTVQEMTQTRPFIEALEKQRAVAEHVLARMNTQAFQELFKTAEKMQSVTQELAKKYEPMTKVMQEVAERYAPTIKAMHEMAKRYEPLFKAMVELSERMNGLTVSTRPLYSLDRNLFDVAHNIRQAGHPEIVKEFEHTEKRGDYTFSPAYEKLKDEEEKIKRQEEVEPWGAWHQLPFAKRMVYEPDMVLEEAKREAKSGDFPENTLLNLFGIAHEMEQMRKGAIADDDMIFFRVKDYKNYLQRVHNYLATQLLKTADITETRLDFDDTSRTLYFNGTSIIIGQKSESDPHKLIRTLFKDTKKIWHNDEVLEDWGYRFDEDVSLSKVYQAGKALNRIIAQETKIKDFVDVDTKKISINKRYLRE